MPTTTTTEDAVNDALRTTSGPREREVAAAMDVLASAQLDNRAHAWR